MSAELTGPASGIRSRPITRSSIRQSLGKALADVMHKDSKESAVEKEKGSKKARDASARRTTTVHLAPRSSIDKPLLRKTERDVSPAAKDRTITRSSKRLSAIKRPATTSSDEQSSLATSPKTSVVRSATLRPRSSLASSALPKYRPKSALIETAPAKRSPSPHAGSRHLISESSDETEGIPKGKYITELQPPPSKASRSISPLPRRGALQVNLTSAINVRPVTPDKKSKNSSPAHAPSPRHTSSRPTKAAKTAVSQTASRTVIPRPPSSSSSSASPRTPKTPTGLSNIKRTGGSSSRDGSPSPRRGPALSAPESPLGKLSARKAANGSPTSIHRASASATPTRTTFTEGNSVDSVDANDVEFMLSAVASPTAPTPALPRFRTIYASESESPQTPSRSPFLPTRSNLSYISPAAPTSDNSPFLRPKAQYGANERGSILSWEQLARHNKTLDDEDVENMISQMPAPFDPGLISPAPSSVLLDIPESPNLSALPSPTGYGSISQVLLPDVTPSPAMYNTSLRFHHMDSDASMGDAANATLLRLQLASAESKAREQLAAIELLQSQLQSAKEARLRDAEELSRQMSQLEEQVHGNLRVDDQRSEYIASLEGQLLHAEALRDQAVQQALAQMHASAQASTATALRAQQARWEVACSAWDAGAAWGAVRDTAEGELELVRANREMLAVLLAGLNHS
ncbi:hypothetical protein BKA93DRAFT_580690 [Sparassis latifolia]